MSGLVYDRTTDVWLSVWLNPWWKWKLLFFKKILLSCINSVMKNYLFFSTFLTKKFEHDRGKIQAAIYQAYIQWENGCTWFLHKNLHIVDSNNRGNKGEGGLTIVESLGLTMANHGWRDQDNLQYTMGEVDMSARLQDGWRDEHNKEVSRLAWPQYQTSRLQWQYKCKLRNSFWFGEEGRHL